VPGYRRLRRREGEERVVFPGGGWSVPSPEHKSIRPNATSIASGKSLNLAPRLTLLKTSAPTTNGSPSRADVRERGEEPAPARRVRIRFAA